ncbi:MAG: hypothetical protein L0Y72_27990 [Gemmataceae bacterium]|nr:hypothetical protein [Gemmataceae bacterium]MCI0742889.1 hypothetical protein [Gemmataceae bacterium]
MSEDSPTTIGSRDILGHLLEFQKASEALQKKNRLLLILCITLLLLTLGTFVYFFIEQRRQLENSLVPAGTFRSGAIMDDIVYQCFVPEGFKGDLALLVVADLAGYGAFSHPEKFSEYINAIKKRANGGKSPVECVFLTPEKKRQILTIQFKDVADINKRKLANYLSGGYGKKALEALQSKFDMNNPTLDGLVDIVVKADELIVEELKLSGAKVYSYDYLLTVHIWSGQNDKALFAFVDFAGAVDEMGFIGTGFAVNHIRGVFTIIKNGVEELKKKS